MSYLPPQRSRSKPYGPLQRRLLGLAGFLAVLMIGLIVFHALHTDSTGLNAVAEAAERTARQPGAKLAIEVTYGAEGSSRSIVGTGSGRYDVGTGRSLADLTVPIPGHGTVQMESVGDERRLFMRSPMFAGELPPDREWLGMEPLLGRNAQTALGGNGSAQSQLEVLEAVGGDVEKLDQQTVRGHLTTRYKGSVELAKAAQIFAGNGKSSLAQEYEKFAEEIPAPVPVEVWIDEHGLARQFRIVQPLPTTGGASLTMDMRVQLYAFGRQPKIELPPKRKVFDYTPILRAELGMEDGSTLGPLTPPPGTKPLSVAAFHQRATALCRGTFGEAQALFDRSGGLVDSLKGLGLDQKAEGMGLLRDYAQHFALPGYRMTARLTRELGRLDPPASLATDYRRFLTLEARSVELNLVRVRVLELGQVRLPSLKDREAEAKTESTEGKRLAARLGVPACARQIQLPGGKTETSSE